MSGSPLNSTRFHALTEKARYTVGGIHSFHFDADRARCATGAVLDGPRLVMADVKASGGARAIAEEQMGRTQRVVIVEASVPGRSCANCRSTEAPRPSRHARAEPFLTRLERSRGGA